MSKKIYDYGTGRRKASVARAFVTKGKGSVVVNGKKIDEYFPANTDWCFKALAPLAALNVADKFDFKVTVKGGGVTGQSGAVCLAIARALVNNELRLLGMSADEARVKKLEASQQQEDDDSSLTPWHDKLRSAGLLTRDPRVVQRKRCGFLKARRKPQFSKR